MSQPTQKIAGNKAGNPTVVAVTAQGELRLARSWADTDSQDNAAATATKAAVTGEAHHITGVSASFSAAAIALLQIKDGTTVIWEDYVHNGLAREFVSPLVITAGAVANAVLAASGTPGLIGKVNIKGFTE